LSRLGNWGSRRHHVSVRQQRPRPGTVNFTEFVDQRLDGRPRESSQRVVHWKPVWRAPARQKTRGRRKSTSMDPQVALAGRPAQNTPPPVHAKSPRRCFGPRVITSHCITHGCLIHGRGRHFVHDFSKTLGAGCTPHTPRTLLVVIPAPRAMRRAPTSAYHVSRCATRPSACFDGMQLAAAPASPFAGRHVGAANGARCGRGMYQRRLVRLSPA